MREITIEMKDGLDFRQITKECDAALSAVLHEKGLAGDPIFRAAILGALSATNASVMSAMFQSAISDNNLNSEIEV